MPARAPGRDVGGHATAMIRLIGPDGDTTLLGIDQQSHFICCIGFLTPRGFHERHYDEFIRLPSGWVQARGVTFFYHGVKANIVFWREVKVDETIDPALFPPPFATHGED